MDNRDNLGGKMTKEEMEEHLQRWLSRSKAIRDLVDQTRSARARLLEGIIAQNLDGHLVGESVSRMEKALRIGFDPGDTKWPPPVVTTYLELHVMVGHANILLEELFLDGQNTTRWDEQLARVNKTLSDFCQNHGEPFLSKIAVTLDELLKQLERTLSAIEQKIGLDAKEYQKQTLYEYSDYILPARDEIEYCLEGLRVGELDRRFGKLRERLHGFDERFRKTLPKSAKKYGEASGRYRLTGGDLEYFPQSFWWRRLGLTRKGEPVWR